MENTILELHAMAAKDGDSFFPGGPEVLYLLNWDQYKNYREISSRLNYVWRVELAFLTTNDSAVRIRQTIKLHGHGIHRKHEVVFALDFQDLSRTEIVTFRGKHPGPSSIPVPGMYHGYDPAFMPTAGPPVGLQMTFQKPIMVRRWSCLPITHEVLEQEMSVFQIAIWFATQRTAQYAKDTFDHLMANPDTLGTSKAESTTTLAPPRFEEFSSMPPGGISRS